ncbi:MAG TPA: ATP-binding protein [Vicinamibacterales bacterium]|jgi:signal transduction histidine kinase
MRLGIKGKQVLIVTSLVGAVVVVLSVLNLVNLARVSLGESQARAELLAGAIYSRAREVIVPGVDPFESLRRDPGLRSMLSASLLAKNVTFAAIADLDGKAAVHADQALEGQPLPAGGNLRTVLSEPWWRQVRAIYSGQGTNLLFEEPLLLGDEQFGSIRVGVSTLLIRSELNDSLGGAVATALLLLGIAVLVAILLAQLVLRPIHVLRSGLTRLGRGELGVRLDLNQHDEFGELGTSFNTVSEQLSADRSQMAGQVANLESAVEHLEDAVAIVDARGAFLFANPAMRTLLPRAATGVLLDSLLAPDHPLRRLSEQTLVGGHSRGPLSAVFGESGERLVMTHAINDPKGALVGIMLVARNVEYLSQVQSTVRYSRKLAALGRLSAGVAHEVKNPLNAMMIHLELLRQRVGTTAAIGVRGGAAVSVAEAPVDRAAAMQHVDVIANEIRRLDEVMQGFLTFARPEDLKLQPVPLRPLIDEVIAIVRPEADRARVELVSECTGGADVNGDPTMLRQAFLNLALNACQAMPAGGTLRIQCESERFARSGRVSIAFTDTGSGIQPDHLKRIFDLYFTTKEKGSGIGLSMVYRTVQMHDGEIEVQSTPGSGTTFRVLLPQA